MLHSMDQAWVLQVKPGGHLGGLRQRLSLAVIQAVASDDSLRRTLAGELLILGRNRGGSWNVAFTWDCCRSNILKNPTTPYSSAPGARLAVTVGHGQSQTVAVGAAQRQTVGVFQGV